MAVHDTIGDFLTILRNASTARRSRCTASYSKVRWGIAKILESEGYLDEVTQETDEKGHPVIAVALKYVNGTPAITGIERASKPGRRLYFGYEDIPLVLGGLGMAILTTSKGIKRARDARREKVGGELLCRVW